MAAVVYSMRRLTAYVSGRVQRTGYRSRVVEIARILGIKGSVQNLDDGRVKIIAEGSQANLRAFVDAIDIKDSLIHVYSITQEFSDATGDYEAFYKLVNRGEIDERLDQGAAIVKDLIVVVKDGFQDIGGKMDRGFGELSGKMDLMLGKQGELLDEIKGARSDFKGYLDKRFERVEGEMAEIKGALKVKGIM